MIRRIVRRGSRGETVDALRRELDHLPVQAVARAGDRGVHDRAHRAADPRDPLGRPGARAAAGVGPADRRRARRRRAWSRSARPGRSSRGRGCPIPSEQHPLDHPFAFAFIRLDGASTPLLHAVDAGSPDALAVGDARRAAVARHPHRPHRRHRRVRARRGARGRRRPTPGRPTEPVTMMDYNASITYRNPVPPVRGPAARGQPRPADPRPAVPGLRAGLRRRSRLLPDRRGRARRGARRRPPALGDDHELHDHHAGAVPGPDRDRAVRPGVRAARRHRRRPPLPARHRAAGRGREGREAGRRGVGAARTTTSTRAARWAARTAHLIGWIPSGEPDVDDPDLVNRIF